MFGPQYHNYSKKLSKIFLEIYRTTAIQAYTFFLCLKTLDLWQRKVSALLCIQFTLEIDPLKNGFPASLTVYAAAQGQCSVGNTMPVCLFVGCLTSQQQASISQGQICSDNSTCCRTEIEVADQTIHLTSGRPIPLLSL